VAGSRSSTGTLPLASLPVICSQIFDHRPRWRASEVPVVGIRIDFDAATNQPGRGRAFLRDLRHRLPIRLQTQYHRSARREQPRQFDRAQQSL